MFVNIIPIVPSRRQNNYLCYKYPEATETAQTIVVGFADMFLPVILGSGIEV